MQSLIRLSRGRLRLYQNKPSRIFRLIRRKSILIYWHSSMQLMTLRTIINSGKDIYEAHKADGIEGSADEFLRQLFGELTLNYIQFKWPTIFHLMRAFRFAEEKIDVRTSSTMYYQRIWEFLKDTGSYFKETFNALQTEEDAAQLADTVFFIATAYAGFSHGLVDKGIIVSYRWDASPDSTTPPDPDAIADRTLSFIIPKPNVLDRVDPAILGELRVSTRAIMAIPAYSLPSVAKVKLISPLKFLSITMPA